MLATLTPMVVMATTARGLPMLLPLPRLILTTVSTASAPITATLATLTPMVLLSMARGPLIPPLLPSLLLIPTTVMPASTATLATPMPMAATATTMARGLPRLLLIPTTATMVDMDTVMGTVDTMAATTMDTTTESKKHSKCQRMK